MINSIYKYLMSDNELNRLLKNDDNSKIRPNKPVDRNNYPYIVYQVSPFLAGVINQYRCEIRIVSNDEFLHEQIVEIVLALMHFQNKKAFQIEGRTIYHSKHVGGGLIYDADKNVSEQILIFTMKAI